MRYSHKLIVVFGYAVCYNKCCIFDKMEGLPMFCKNCGIDVTNMKYCSNCEICVDNIESKKVSNYVHLTEKDYRKHYVTACCLSTSLFRGR